MSNLEKTEIINVHLKNIRGRISRVESSENKSLGNENNRGNKKKTNIVDVGKIWEHNDNTVKNNRTEWKL